MSSFLLWYVYHRDLHSFPTRRSSDLPIAVPGIYSGMPIDDYHGDNAATEVSISSGGLRTIINKSPAHYWVTSPYNKKRSEEHTSELQSLRHLVCRLLLEKKKKQQTTN